MTDPMGRLLIRLLEQRFEKLAKQNQLMRIVGSKFTIWVTKR